VSNWGSGFKATYRLNLLQNSASYSLSIDSQLPIDTLVLQSATGVEILPSKQSAFKVTNIRDKSCGLLSQVKIETRDQKKVQLQLRTPEGQSSIISVLIIPYGDEHTGVSLEVPIKSLNLHERVSIIDTANLPISVIKLSGKFDAQDALKWVSNCIADPPASIDHKTELFFKNVLLGTYLSLQIEDGAVVIKSDNLSVMAIMKDSFTADASARKIAVNVEETELDWTSLDHVINILNPMVQKQYEIAQKYQLIDGLKEIVAGENDTAFLS
jgi:hypothetical protein